MKDRPEPKLPKWPFFLGNIIMLALAVLLFNWRESLPLGGWAMLLLVVCGAAGAGFAVAPFVIEHRAALKMMETGALVSTVAQIRNLELLAVQINAATARWQVVQEHSTNSVTAAQEIAEKMTAETAAFTEFLTRANDIERANLRLEVDKLRRMENEWLQVIMRLLDHSFALYKAAELSAQPELVEQLGKFQDSCRDVARRIGLIPMVAAANEIFDPQCHHTAEETEKPEGARIRDTIATGFTYQGRLIRPILVSLQNGTHADGPSPKETVGQESLL